MMYGKWLAVTLMFVLAAAVAISGAVDGTDGHFSRVIEWPMGDGGEQNSPGNHITEDQIHVFADRIVIEVSDARWATFTDTNSMDPVFDEGANAIQIVPKDPEQIEIGDIISYELDGHVIIHRVQDIGYDENGWYAITKGDNLREPDPEPVRFDKVTKLVIGILY